MKKTAKDSKKKLPPPEPVFADADSAPSGGQLSVLPGYSPTVPAGGKPHDKDKPTIVILRLAQSFPCLAQKLRAWDPVTFDPDKFLGMLAGASHVEGLCGLFLLSVWNPDDARAKGWTFDLFEFIGAADVEHRRALMNWIANPVWP